MKIYKTQEEVEKDIKDGVLAKVINKSMVNKDNCEKCYRSYAPYKTGKDEDVGAYNCEIPVFLKGGKLKPPKGVCQFCNPKSVFYLTEY